MIPDNQTNFLYLADTLPLSYPGFYKRLEKLLKECKIDFALLPNTKDVWAVDYMPLQIDQDNFVQFVYRPSYLINDKKYEHTISDVNTICASIGINTKKFTIKLDGGNVIRTKNKVILTDRVFTENPNYDREELIKELYAILGVDHIYFIPQQPHDFSGHADGMVRFINDDILLINDYKRESKTFKKAFDKAIRNTGLDYIAIPYNVYGNDHDDQANGCYINYLHMKNQVVIPTFGLKEDEDVVRQLENIFSGMQVSTIDSNEIAKDGGVLNCISWNILKETK